jgi:hypothetical protein
VRGARRSVGRGDWDDRCRANDVPRMYAPRAARTCDEKVEGSSGSIALRVSKMTIRSWPGLVHDGCAAIKKCAALRRCRHRVSARRARIELQLRARSREISRRCGSIISTTRRATPRAARAARHIVPAQNRTSRSGISDTRPGAPRPASENGTLDYATAVPKASLRRGFSLALAISGPEVKVYAADPVVVIEMRW